MGIFNILEKTNPRDEEILEYISKFSIPFIIPIKIYSALKTGYNKLSKEKRLYYSECAIYQFLLKGAERFSLQIANLISTLPNGSRKAKIDLCYSIATQSETCEAKLKQYAIEYPDSVPLAKQSLVYDFTKAGKRSSALMLKYQEVLSKDHNYWLELSGQYLSEGSDDAAVYACENALLIEPNFELALLMMGDLLLELERYSEALQYYAKVVRTGKRKVRGMWGLVACLPHSNGTSTLTEVRTRLIQAYSDSPLIAEITPIVNSCCTVERID